MQINDYQLHASLTIGKHDEDFFLRKLSTEVVEVAKELAFIVREKPNEALILELGDVIRNVAQIATLNKIKMSDLLEANIMKMDERSKNSQL